MAWYTVRRQARPVASRRLPYTGRHRSWAAKGKERPAVNRSIWIVKIRCTDPAREAEFNRWYDDVHVPDVLRSAPEVLAGQRYKRAGPPSPGELTAQYLVIYELDAKDPQAVLDKVFREYGPESATPMENNALMEVISI